MFWVSSDKNPEVEMLGPSSLVIAFALKSILSDVSTVNHTFFIFGLIPRQGTCLGCGSGPQYRAHERQPHIAVSLPLFLPSSLSKNKYRKSFLKKERYRAMHWTQTGLQLTQQQSSLVFTARSYGNFFSWH